MLVALWSSVHGQTATTSNTIAISTMTSMDYKFKSLVTHTHFDKNTLEASLLDKSYLKGNLYDLTDTGIDALARFCRLNKLNSGMVKNYTKSIIIYKLDILIGTLGTHRELYIQNISDVIDQIISTIEGSYEISFIDVCPGMNDITKKIIERSDVVIVNLCQNYHVIDEYFELYEKEIEKKKKLYVVGRYDYNSRINLKAIKRRYSIKGDICAIPYSIEFSDSLSNGNAIEFFMKESNCTPDDINYKFIQEIRNTVEKMLNISGIEW